MSLLDYSTEHHFSMHLATVVASLPGLIYWVDKRGVHRGCNHNVLRMLGITQEAYVGKTYEELARIAGWEKSETEFFKQSDFEVLKTGVPQFNVEKSLVRRQDGKKLYYLTNRVPIRNEDGEVVGVVGFFINITERKRLEEELKMAKDKAEYAHRHVSEWVEHMSDGMSIALSGMTNLLHLLKTFFHHSQRKPLLQEEIHILYHCSSQLMHLLSDMLEHVMQAHTEVEKVNEATFDLRASIKNLCDLISPIVTFNHHLLKIDIDPSIPQYIRSNRVRVECILLMLLSRFAHCVQRNYIELKVRRRQNDKGAFIEFHITQAEVEGKTVEPHRDIINQHGYREDEKILHRIRKMATALKGELTQINQTRVKVVFAFILPLKTEVDHQKPPMISSHGEESSAAEITSLQHNIADIFDLKPIALQILFVEDDPIAQRVGQTMLKQLGCEVKIAADGETALKLATTEEYDLILTDMGLPGMSGDELTILIREWEKSSGKKRVPIIGLTAHTPEEMTKSIALGMDKIVLKPLTLAVARDILREFVSFERTSTPSLHTLEKSDPFHLEGYLLFDVDQGLKTLGGNKRILRDVLTTLISQIIPTETAHMQKAYRENDWESMKKIARKLRGSALYCGAIKMSYVCQYIEDYLGSEPRPLLVELYQQLVHILTETKHTIENWLNQKK